MSPLISGLGRFNVHYPETINPHNLCCQCLEHGPYWLFGKLRIKDFNDEPHLTKIIKLLSSQIQMNTLFKNNYFKKEGDRIKLYTNL